MFHSFEQYGMLRDIFSDMEFKDEIIWEKTNPMPRNRDRRYVSNIETASWYVKPKGKWTFNRQSQNYDSCVFRFPSESGGGFTRYHPCQKNLELIKQLILRHSNPNDIVLDPFIGGGTTAIACIATGRSYIGFERDKGYFDISIRRIEETKAHKEADQLKIMDA